MRASFLSFLIYLVILSMCAASGCASKHEPIRVNGFYAQHLAVEYLQDKGQLYDAYTIVDRYDSTANCWWVTLGKVPRTPDGYTFIKVFPDGTVEEGSEPADPIAAQELAVKYLHENGRLYDAYTIGSVYDHDGKQWTFIFGYVPNTPDAYHFVNVFPDGRVEEFLAGITLTHDP